MNNVTIPSWGLVSGRRRRKRRLHGTRLSVRSGVSSRKSHSAHSSHHYPIAFVWFQEPFRATLSKSQKPFPGDRFKRSYPCQFRVGEIELETLTLSKGHVEQWAWQQTLSLFLKTRFHWDLPVYFTRRRRSSTAGYDCVRSDRIRGHRKRFRRGFHNEFHCSSGSSSSLYALLEKNHYPRQLMRTNLFEYSADFT